MEHTVKTVLITAEPSNPHITGLELYHLTPGYGSAGSGTRIAIIETWCVSYFLSGVRQSRSFKTLQEAQQYFTKFTKV